MTPRGWEADFIRLWQAGASQEGPARTSLTLTRTNVYAYLRKHVMTD
jgi:hypothetical protein